MQKPKISFVVPVYKSENYIRRCLDSLINQTLEDIEIVCVNDGSPDNSLNILREYEEKYSNIKVISKENGGVWYARLDGVKAANGEYIGFLDADDYVEKDFAKLMYESVSKNQSDIAVCGFKRIDEETKKVLSQEMKHSSSRVIFMDKNPEEIISVNTALWNKIYKADVLKATFNVQSPPRILEDAMFISLVYINAHKISFVDEYLHNYMVINGSAMHSLRSNDIVKIKESMLEVKEEYLKANLRKEMMEILSSFVFLHLGISLMLNVYTFDKANFKSEYKQILNYLDSNFGEWRSTKYTTIWYNLTHKKYNLKVAIVRKVYKMHMFKAFLDIYSFVTKTLKIDIKW